MQNPTDDLATYALKVAGRDRSWMDDGLCRTGQVPAEFYLVGEMESVRTVEGSTMTIVEVKGKDAHAIAVDLCRECPVQWECARWAVEVEEPNGVWSMTSRLLRWLQRRPDALGIIDTARVRRIAVQDAVYAVWLGDLRLARSKRRQ